MRFLSFLNTVFTELDSLVIHIGVSCIRIFSFLDIKADVFVTLSCCTSLVVRYHIQVLLQLIEDD